MFYFSDICAKWWQRPQWMMHLAWSFCLLVIVLKGKKRCIRRINAWHVRSWVSNKAELVLLPHTSYLMQWNGKARDKQPHTFSVLMCTYRAIISGFCITSRSNSDVDQVLMNFMCLMLMPYTLLGKGTMQSWYDSCISTCVALVY